MPEVRREFFEEHLLPAAYLADHESVHELLEILFSLHFNDPERQDDDIKYEIIHFKKKEFLYGEEIKVYEETLLFRATDHLSKQMMMEIVRAECNVHRAKGNLFHSLK